MTRLLTCVLASLLLCPSVWAEFSYDTTCELDTSLTTYWQLEEASGTRLDQLSGCGGGGCDLTDNNTVTQESPGKIGDAASFALVTSEYFTRADHADVSTGDIDFTVAAWVLLDSKPATIMTIMTRGDLDTGGTDIEYVLNWVTGTDRFRFEVRNTEAATASAFGAPSLATWYFVVGWHDAAGNTVNIQVNNTTAVSTATGGAVSDLAEALYIGAQNGSVSGTIRFWDGDMDEIGFWKRVLTAQERTDLYNGGTGSQFAPATACSLTAWLIGKTSLIHPCDRTVSAWPDGHGGFHPVGSGPGSMRRALASCRAS